MMRLFPILLLMTFSSIFAQPAWQNTKVESYLRDQLIKDPQSFNQLVILLKDKVDVLAMSTGLYERNASLEERSYEIITALKAKAALTQPALLNYIRSLAGIKTETIESYWINNSIFVYGNAQAVAALSQRDDIEYIGLYVPPKAYETRKFDCSPQEINVPNGHELGHDVINATDMWALGYTGANTKLLVIDTGTELDHASLFDNYWGNRTSHAEAWYAPNSPYPYPQDCDNHGTHVTGTSVGVNRATHDTIGIAFNAWWMASPAIRPQDSGEPCQGIGGPNVVSALQWAIDPDNNPSTIDDRPDIINNSWGQDKPTTCFHQAQSAINALEAVGVGLVFAAGNDTFPSTIGGPAHLNSSLVNSFAVGSVDANRAGWPISNFSSQGPTVCPGTGSLKIKPEVVAPGWPIRSAGKSGGYLVLGGTSMAAPHVSGALLLLKEAFPTLTGEQLKLALYNTAFDLGAAGEDNVYGMGMIDVMAAFNYLVNQGNTPVIPPASRNAFISSVEQENLCGLSPEPSVKLSNQGKGTLNSIAVAYSYSDGFQGTATWTGTLQPGATTTFKLPAHTFASTGVFQLHTEIDKLNGQDPYYLINNQASSTLVIIDDPGITTTGANACIGASVLISATQANPDHTIRWYDALSGGNFLGEGNSLVTPTLSSSFIFYAASAGREDLGPETSASANGISFPGAESFLKFDCFSPFRLKSVKVNSIANGLRVIQLRDSNDLVLAAKSVNIPVGEQEVELNFDIVPGKSYHLGLGVAGSANLMTAISGYNFPYEIPEVMAITGSNNGFYPFFYDWEISWELPCERVRALVSASSGNTNADFSINDTLVFGGQNVLFTDQSTNANKWKWDFGDGGSSTVQNPAHAYNIKGAYTISMMATGSQNCSDATSKTVTVVNSTAIEDDWKRLGDIQVFPNPNNGFFIIDLKLTQPKNIKIKVVDMLGNQLWEQNAGVYLQDEIPLDLSGLSDGVYLLKIDLEGVSFVDKIVKVQ